MSLSRLPHFARALLIFFGVWVTGLLLAVIVFRKNVVERTHTFYGDWDASVQSYAWNHANATAIRSIHLKLWDFTTSSGTSFAGEMQTAPFYPVNWIFAWLADPSSVEAQEWRLLAHFALAFAGAYFLLRHNRHSRPASATGATLVAFIGSFALRAAAQPNIFESLSYLPLVVWLCQRAMESTGAAWRSPAAWHAGCACGLMILAGHLQPPIHAGMAAALLALVIGPFRRRELLHRFGVLCFIGLVAFLTALPQLAATIEYLALSYRWIGAEKPTAPPHRIPYEIYALKYILVPGDWRQLFDAARSGAEGSTLFIGISGLVFAVAGFLRPGRFGLFAIILGVSAVLVAMGDGSYPGRLSYYFPGVGMVRQPVRILCLYHLAAGILVAGGVDFMLKKASRLPGPVWCGLAAIPVIALAGEAAANGVRNLQSRQAGLYPPTYYSAAKKLGWSARTLATPGAAYRYITSPDDVLPPNYGNVDGSLSLRGHRATMQMRYFKYLRRDWSPTGESFRRLGLRYVFSRTPLNLPRIASAGDLVLYERPDALSVFQIIDDTSARSARLTDIRWNDNSVTLTPAPDESGRLLFAQVRYPGWQVRVDGRRAELLKEGDFFAVNLPLGSHSVAFNYRPLWLWPAAVLALSSLIATQYITLRRSRAQTDSATRREGEKPA